MYTSVGLTATCTCMYVYIHDCVFKRKIKQHDQIDDVLNINNSLIKLIEADLYYFMRYTWFI